MSNNAAGNANLLIKELMNVQELTRLLEAHLSDPPAESLLRHIQSTLHRAISLVECSGYGDGEDSPTSVGGARDSDDSPRGRWGRRETPKKKKALPQWTTEMKANPGSSVDCPPEDGFSWRKYGQKKILESEFPRGYYRCTNKKSHGCPAMKQVQRFDMDSTVFKIIYIGEHACPQRVNYAPAPATGPGNVFLIDGSPGLTVTTHGLVGSPSISPSPTPMSRMRAELAQAFSLPATPHAGLSPASFSPPFSSFPGAGRVQFMEEDTFNGVNHGGAAESDRGEMLSVDASADSSPAMDLEFLLDVDFDHGFSSGDASAEEAYFLSHQ